MTKPEMIGVVQALNPKGIHALEFFLECYANGFTGSLTIDFHEGTPQLVSRHAKYKLGKGTDLTPARKGATPLVDARKPVGK